MITPSMYFFIYYFSVGEPPSLAPCSVEKNVTQTCVVIVVVFIICQLPIWANGCIGLLQEVNQRFIVPETVSHLGR